MKRKKGRFRADLKINSKGNFELVQTNMDTGVVVSYSEYTKEELGKLNTGIRAKPIKSFKQTE